MLGRRQVRPAGFCVGSPGRPIVGVQRFQSRQEPIDVAWFAGMHQMQIESGNRRTLENSRDTPNHYEFTLWARRVRRMVRKSGLGLVAAYPENGADVVLKDLQALGRR